MFDYKLYRVQIKAVMENSVPGCILASSWKLFIFWALIIVLFPGFIGAGLVVTKGNIHPDQEYTDPPAPDSTLVCGIVTGFEVWESEFNPYILVGDLIVADSAVLEIREGVRILARPSFAPEVRPDHKEGFGFYVYGALICRGTASDPVQMLPLGNEPEPGCWGGVRFGNTSVDASFDTYGAYTGGSIMEWTEISFAGSSAIVCRMSSPYIHSCKFTNNVAYRDHGDRQIVDPYAKPEERIKGGAVFLFRPDSELKIEECVFTENISRHMGGAIAVIESFDTPVSIMNCIFTGNRAELSDGGAIRLLGSSVDISGCTFTGNTAYKGGAIHTSFYGNGAFESNTFSGNNADRAGGGVFISHRSSPKVSGNVFLNNTAVDAAMGGALVLWDHVCSDVVSNEFTGNVSNSGSAIACYLLDNSQSKHANIHDNEIHDNSSPDGGLNTAILLIDTDYLEMTGNIVHNPSEIFEIYSKYYLSEEPSECIIDAESNYWGEIDLEQLESRIFHHPDNLKLPTVDFEPAMESPPSITHTHPEPAER